MTATVRGISTERRDGNIASSLEREYTVTYYVTTDSWSDGPQTVLDMPGIPALWDTYSLGNDNDSFAIVHSKRATQREAPDEWEVEVTYRTMAGDTPFGSPGGTSPLDMLPKITASTHNRNVVIPGRYMDPRNPRIDAPFDMGVHMSNGEHCDPPPEIEISEPVISISRNVTSINWPFIMSVTNAVNSEPFFGCEARQLRLSTPHAESAYDSIIGQYWKLTYDLVYKYETWDVQFLNRGTYYLGELANYPGVTERIPFKDAEGHPFLGLLDEYGNAINKDDDTYRGIYHDGGDPPTFQRLRVYREVDFNVLGILV